MFISEVTFPHLQAEREARLTRELERRRVVDERRAEEVDARAATTGARSAAATGWALLRRNRRPAPRARCATC
ncbi:hypothetical protein [Agromyces bauzanensis]|uniref:Uncharacterized protein n=1 Tax=Agromyces bauzanensis TaxID=1308924 RepID=A0A917PE83_9MICO|nr:hypothetical protein [Agromyces bauzanensis]GGJ72879.1 hypothetical protein GCM10011372_08490 [Agromyces bauzanensis]